MTLGRYSPIKVARRVTARARADLFLSDRRAEYENILKRLRAGGFASLTLRELASRRNSSKGIPERWVILRHDIDTDPDYALVWLTLERKYGFTASYYFRQCTANVKLMQHIEQSGSEASYHFEELATIVRRRGQWDGPVTESLIAEARCEFEQNFCALRANTKLPLLSVASHGDFVNRRLGVTNSVILDCVETRQRLGIIAEAYDVEIVDLFDARISDIMGNERWRWSNMASNSGKEGPSSEEFRSPDPVKLIEHGAMALQILTHPRHWRANIASNLRENCDRLLMGCLALVGLPAGRLASRSMTTQMHLNVR